MSTEDGWEPSPRIEPDSPLLVWKQVPGSDVTIQVRDDDAGRLMLAYAADYHAYVEPLIDAQTACYTPTNSVSTSNHLNATAMDFDWESYPWKQRGNLTGDKLARLRDLLAFYDPWMFWAGDWDDAYVDEMHHQMNYGSYELAQQGKLAQWVKANLRPDGFSVYNRDSHSDAPPVMTVPLVQNADGTWTSPSPAWAHLIMRESSGNPTIIQQIIDVNSGGNEAEGLFQITPRTWLAHGGDEFALSARSATPQQQALVAARVFTSNPSGSDWGAGLPGRENPQQLAAGLVPTTNTGGVITLADVSQDEWNQLVADVKEIRAQLGGDWPQNGNDPQAAADLDKRKATGDRLTPNDILAWIKNHTSTHQAPTP